MKQNLRNLSVFGAVGLIGLATSVGCSDDAATPLGGGNFPSTAGTNTGTAGMTTGTAGNTAAGSGTGGAGTSGSSTGGASGSGTAGTFVTGGGGSGTAGSFTTAGTDTGGTAAGMAGAGGTAAGAAGMAGTGGTPPTDDFPQGCPAPSATAHATNKLTKTCWKASATDCSLGNAMGLVNPPSQAFDADTMTRFSTGAKMTASKLFTFDVDLGKAVMINGISTTTMTASDTPPQIEVAISTNGTAWTPVACANVTSPVDISFAAVSARYVRLVQHGTADAWWSIHDLDVYRSGADDTCGDGATATMCTSTANGDTAQAGSCCANSHKL